MLSGSCALADLMRTRLVPSELRLGRLLEDGGVRLAALPWRAPIVFSIRSPRSSGVRVRRLSTSLNVLGNHMRFVTRGFESQPCERQGGAAQAAPGALFASSGRARTAHSARIDTVIKSVYVLESYPYIYAKYYVLSLCKCTPA